jgi:hypothetical protein
MTSEKPAPKQFSPVVYRLFYAAFVCFGVYFLIRGDWFSAVSQLGIALIFDPFNGLKWELRKGWQKAWLFVHVLGVILLLIFAFLKK